MAILFCVVDGRASTRASWPRQFVVNGVTYVSCDFHSDAAIKDAINQIAAGTANSVSPSASVPSSRNHSKSLHDSGSE